VEPIVNGAAEVVFGTRTFGSHTAYSFWYVIGNKVVTHTANLRSTVDQRPGTCYKLMLSNCCAISTFVRRGWYRAEVTAKLLSRGIRPYEVRSPIAPQSAEGKS